MKYTNIMFLQLPAGNLHPRGWDKDLLVKLPVDRKGSCNVIPRKLSCQPLVLVEIRRGTARNKILLAKEASPDRPLILTKQQNRHWSTQKFAPRARRVSQDLWLQLHHKPPSGTARNYPFIWEHLVDAVK